MVKKAPGAADRDTSVLHVRIPHELLEQIDHAVEAGGYTNRAELVRSAIRNEVAR